jgi:hypothetical protein
MQIKTKPLVRFRSTESALAFGKVATSYDVSQMRKEKAIYLAKYDTLLSDQKVSLTNKLTLLCEFATQIQLYNEALSVAGNGY